MNYLADSLDPCGVLYSTCTTRGRLPFLGGITMGCTEGFAFGRIVIYAGLIVGFICTSKREPKGSGLSQRSACSSAPTDRCLNIGRSKAYEMTSVLSASQ